MKNMKIDKIKKILPNRYPYLLIDYVEEIVPGISAKAHKNMTANEWFFPVHFPEDPMMPGMIQMEALFQTLCLTALSMEENAGGQVKGISAEKIRLKRRVVPGSRMDIEAEVIYINGSVFCGKARGKIAGAEVCSAEFTFTVVKGECNE